MARIDQAAAKRQRKAIRMYKQGQNIRWIASDLKVSQSTVRAYVKGVQRPRDKPHAETRTFDDTVERMQTKKVLAQALQADGILDADLDAARVQPCTSINEALDILENEQATSQSLYAVMLSPDRKIKETVYEPEFRDVYRASPGGGTFSSVPTGRYLPVEHETDLMRFLPDHPAFSPQLAERVLQDNPESGPHMLATGRYTDSATLDNLSNHPRENVRLAVIRNPNTTQDTINQFVDDESEWVRRELIHSGKLNPQALESMRDSESSWLMRRQAKKALKRLSKT